jgi:dTDP-4-amino-4,6-dideoxygalactose transaminase
MLNYAKHSIDNKDIQQVIKVLKYKNITQGSEVIKFEKNLCKIFGAKDVAVLSNGTAALHLSGIVLGWKPGDVVLTTPITFVSTANSVIFSGAKIDFVDINPTTYNIDVNLLEKKIKNYRKKKIKVKSVIAVDYAGHPCDWKKLKFLSKKYLFSLINDNCHAIGAKYQNTLKYAVKYADLVTHSYHAVKNITTGEGGAVLSKNKALIKKIKILRTHGLYYYNRPKCKNLSSYDMQSLGFNYRVTDFQCALGISQLKKLSKFIKKKRKIINLYNKGFEEDFRFVVPKEIGNIYHAYHLYPLLINFNKIKITKKILYQKMLKYKIKLQNHYLPIYRHSYYRKNFNFNIKDYPNSETSYEKQISLPLFYGIKKSEILKVIKYIKNICK